MRFTLHGILWGLIFGPAIFGGVFSGSPRDFFGF